MEISYFDKQLLNIEPQLKDYAFSLTCDVDKANDLLQETYLRAFTREKLPIRKHYFIYWMLSIMKNIFKNNCRKEKRMLVVYGDIYCSLVDESRNSEYNEAESRLVSQDLDKVLQSLSFKKQKPFLLYLQGYRYREISDKMNLSIENIRSRIYSSRQTLQKQLKEII